MIRWWDYDVFLMKRTPSEDEILRMKQEIIKTVDENEANKSKGLRRCKFRVQAETRALERVGITGNCPELGSWDPEKTVVMEREGETNVWSAEVMLPMKQKIKYRYVVVTDENYKKENIKIGQAAVAYKSLRRWEGGKVSRKIQPISDSPLLSPSFRKECLSMSREAVRMYTKKEKHIEADIFGRVDNTEKVIMGWLTTDSVLVIKMFNCSLNFADKTFEEYPIYTRLRTIKVEIDQLIGSEDFCEDYYDGWPIVEVSALDENRRKFKRQDEFGIGICRDDNLIFHVFHELQNHVGLIFDFYFHYDSNKRLAKNVKLPLHVGLACIHPCKFSEFDGEITASICNVRGSIIGSVQFRYISITNSQPQKYRFDQSLPSSWKKMWSFQSSSSKCVLDKIIKTCSETRENTLASLEMTAAKGVDFVEITVYFTRDGIPIFSHSPYITVAIKHPNELFPQEQYQVPVEKFLLSQLRRMKKIPSRKCSDVTRAEENVKFSSEDSVPFPTLMNLLNGVNKNVGFIIEINTMIQQMNGEYENCHHYDVNKNVNKLLSTLQQSAGRRNVILTCFHPDVCSMLKLKQNVYPIIFLPEGIPDKYPNFKYDVRCRDLQCAINYAVSMEMYGLGLTEETIMFLDNAYKLQKEKLIALCVNDSTESELLESHLIKWNLRGIVNNRKDEKGRFFRTYSYEFEPKEKERNMIRDWAEQTAVDGYLKPAVVPLEYPNRYVLELESTLHLDAHERAPTMSKTNSNNFGRLCAKISELSSFPSHTN